MNKSPLENLGAARLVAQVRGRQPAMNVFRELFKDVDTPTAAIFSGAVGQALDMLTTARNKGARLSSPDPFVDVVLKLPGLHLAIELNRMFAKGEFTRISHVLRAVAGGLDALARSNPEMLEQADTQAPLDVRVVGLPDRVTETSVGRNAAGEITRSTQIETDLK